MSTVTSEIRLRIRADGDKVLVDLGAKLTSLANQATLSSNNFKGLAEELKKVQQTTIQSARNIKDYSASWRELASSVDISSKEFKQATAEAARLDAQLAKIQGTSVRTAAAVQTAMRGPVTGGTAGAGIMGKAATPLEPYPRLGFETLDPEFWRERQRNAKDKQGNVLGQLNQPQFLDYGATDKALGNLKGSLQNVRDIENRSRIERLELQEKFNNLEIETLDRQAAKKLAKEKQLDDIAGRDFMQRLENREKQKSKRRQRFAGAAQTVGAVAASGVFGGPEGLIGAGIGAAFGPQGALIGGAIGAQAGIARQALGATGDYVAELSKLQIALSGVSRDQADFEKNLSSINRLSNQFLIPLKDTTQQYTKLQASVVGAGMQSKVTETVFKGISAATLATGGSIEDLNASLRATAQVFSKGKVSAEELRQQIGERLPGAFTIFASSIGKTPQELDKALEDGKVTLEDFEKFSKELFRRYGKTAEIIAQAPQNAGARLNLELDKITKVIGRFTQPIGAAFQSLGAEIVKGLAPALESLANLIDAPKQLASERLKQLDRQLAQENQALLESRNYSKTLRKGPSVFGSFAAEEQKMRENTIKTLKAERLLNIETAKQTGAAVDDVKLQKQLEEDRKVTKAREQALISLRELEQKTINDLADLREKQIKRALDLERQIIDQRLKAERDLQDIKKETQYSQEDFDFTGKLIELRGAGQNTDALEAAKAAGEITRNLERETTRLKREREDQAEQRQKTLENFKKTNAEEVGRIQLNYTRQSANILEKTGDQLKAAMKEGAKEFKDSVIASVRKYIRSELGLPARTPEEGLVAPPPPNLPPPDQAPRSQVQPFARRSGGQNYGVGDTIPASVTRITVSPFRRVETETQNLGRTQEAKNTNELNKAKLKSLNEYIQQEFSILKPLDDQKILLKEQLKDRERINKMIDSGTLPSMAQEYLQIEKSGEKRKEGLIALRDEINANVELNNLGEADLKNRDKLLLSINQQIQGIDAAVAATKGLVISVSPLQEFIRQGSAELRNLESVAVTVSQGIGSAVSNSVSSGIQGLVEGTANAQQIFSDFLKSIGQILIQEGAKMIATYTAIAIAKSLAGLFGGGGGGGGGAAPAAAPSGTLPQTDMFKYVNLDGLRAAGGPVSSNSTYMVGEKGPELFVPSSSGTIIPADATAAMARYQRQGGGSGGGNSSGDAMGDGAAATPVLSMSFETTRFLGQDYVSTDQLQAAMMATERRAAAAGAKAGAAQVTSKLQQSPSYRRQVGLR